MLSGNAVHIEQLTPCTVFAEETCQRRKRCYTHSLLLAWYPQQKTSADDCTRWQIRLTQGRFEGAIGKIRDFLVQTNRV